MDGKRDTALRGQTRTAAVVILVAMLAWMFGSWLGGRLGLPVRFAFLLDLACLAAMAWSAFVLIKVRRVRRNLEN